MIGFLDTLTCGDVSNWGIPKSSWVNAKMVY